MQADNAQILAKINPIGGETYSAEFPANITLSELLSEIPSELDLQVRVNGRCHDRSTWPFVTVLPGQQVVVSPRPGDDDVLRSVALVVVAVGAAWAGGVAAGWAAQAGWSAAGITAAKVGASVAFSVIGSMAVNALFPPRMPTGAANSTISGQRRKSLTGTRNRANLYGPFPRTYGTFRWFPPLAANEITEISGNDQFLRVLLHLGYGPLNIGGVVVDTNNPIDQDTPGVAPGTLKIGDSDIENFDDVSWQIGTYSSQTLFTRDIQEEQPGVAFDLQDQTPVEGWNTDNVTAVRTTSVDATEATLDVTFPGGLFTVNDNGRLQSSGGSQVEFRVRYKPTGSPDSSYVTVIPDPWTIREARKETLRRSTRIIFPTPGQWDVELTRVRTYLGNTVAYQANAVWTAFRSFRNDSAWTEDQTLMLAMRIRASDQLNGVIDQLSIKTSAILPVWDGVSFTNVATNNPAWAALDSLQGPQAEEPLSNSEVDLQDFLDFADWCDLHGYEFNFTFDSPQTLVERIQDILSAAHASWQLRDDIFTVVWERPEAESPVTQLITSRNMRSFSSQKSFKDLPHALRVNFIDPNTWEDDLRIVYRTGYNEANATKFEDLETIGVTDAEQAWRLGQYFFRQAQLRPETHSGELDFENLASVRGDRVLLQEDSILVGLYTGRVQDLQTDVNGDVVQITIDEDVYMEVGTAYGARFRLSDNTYPQESLVNSGTVSNVLDLAAPVAGVQVGDLVTVGELGQETLDCRVLSVSHNADFSASMEFVPAALDIMDFDTSPNFDPVITEPPDLTRVRPPIPAITHINSGTNTLYRDTDGSLKSSVAVAFEFPSGRRVPVETVRARYRVQGGASWLVESVPVGRGVVRLSEAEEGTTIEIQLQSISSWGVFSEWSATSQTTVVGKEEPPSTVSNFSVNPARDRIVLQWDAVPDADVEQYELRSGGSDWATASFITRVGATSFQYRTTDTGPWRIKAIDTSGNYSVNDQVANLSINLAEVTSVRSQVVDNNVLLSWDAVGGTFDLAYYQISKGTDYATSEVIGRSDTTFDVLFETSGGEFTYWVAPVDSGGNVGTPLSRTVAVAEPPDFELSGQFSTDWEGSVSTNLVPIASVPLPARLSTRDQSALEFDGVDDYVDFGDVLDQTGSFTVEALVYPLDVSTTGQRLVIKDDDTSGWALSIADPGTDGSFRFYHRQLNTANTDAPAHSLVLGRWQRVSAVVDLTADTVTLYVDGVQVAQTTGQTNTITGNAADLLIGGDGATAWYEGRMADVRIWSAARTQQQIQDYAQRTLTGEETDLAAYWRMQDIEGDTLKDGSGNGSSGQIYGASKHVPVVRAVAPSNDYSRDELIALGYTSRDDMIAAGYDYRAQPTPTTSEFEEVYDIGTVIPSTRVQVTLSKQDVVGTVTSSVQISTKTNLADPWTDFPVGQSEIYAVNFRYVKVRVEHTASDDTAFAILQDVNTVLSTKVKSDAGSVEVTANPTTVQFNVSFVDVHAVIPSSQGDSSLVAVADFEDVPNPTSFDLYLFDNSGNPATGIVGWTARGV